MKRTISIALPAKLLAEIDRVKKSKTRSAFIENILRDYLHERRGVPNYGRELRRINKARQSLNAEATHILNYQFRPG
jgi:metal-responsive CopG/Arc/MetJ family transcriptional regulator